MTKNLSVTRWLEELKGSVEMECLSVLQGKSLKKLHYMSPSPARSTFNYQIACFQKLIELKNEIKAQTQPYKMTNVVDLMDKLDEIKMLCSQLSKHESDDELSSRLDLLVSDFESLSNDFGQKVKSLNGQTPKVKNKKIKLLFNVVNSLLSNLMTYLTKDFVENFLHPCLNPYSEDSNNSNINVIISDDEDERNVYEIDNEEGNEGNMENDFKNIIEHLVKIALSSEDALSLLIEMNVIDQLLKTCSSPSKHHLHTQVLRSLATICSSKMAVKDFIQNNGLECMAELIDHCSSNQLIRFEVVGVIAMVTSPQMAVDQDIQSLIPYLDIIVCNIIDWLSIPGSSASEKLLMISCLCNITYLNVNACEIINKKNFLSVLFPTSNSLVFFQPNDPPTSELLKYQILQLISFMAEHGVIMEEHLNDNICEGLSFLLAACLGDFDAFFDENTEKAALLIGQLSSMEKHLSSIGCKR